MLKLEAVEFDQVEETVKKIEKMTWDQIYKTSSKTQKRGLNWEIIETQTTRSGKKCRISSSCATQFPDVVPLEFKLNAR